MRDLSYLNLKDLKSVAKYYQIEHKSRIKRVELEALVCLAEISLGLGAIEGYNASLEVMDVEDVPPSLLDGVLPAEAVPHSVFGSTFSKVGSEHSSQ